MYPLISHLRASRWTSPFLDGANAAAIGLMVGVAWQLELTSIVAPLTAMLAFMALLLLIRFRVNSAWLVACGGAVGLAWRFVAR